MGDTFVQDVASHITTNNVPPGLTPVFERDSDTVVIMTLDGAADNHAGTDDRADLAVTFDAAAFTTETAAFGATYTAASSCANGCIEFIDPSGPILSHSSLDIAEGSSTYTYTVQLEFEPTSNVEVAIGSDNDDVTTIPASLTFTPINFDDTQSVTIMVKQDDDSNPDTAILTHTASGGGYNERTSTLRVNVNDDEQGLTFRNDPTDRVYILNSAGLSALAECHRRYPRLDIQADRAHP